MEIVNFIKTSDSETAEKLISEKFTLLSKEGNIYTFLNNGSMNFSDKEKKKLIYTNILNM